VRIVVIQGERLDKAYIERWLRFVVGASDPALDRFRQIAVE
jgi:hypothetical protein